MFAGKTVAVPKATTLIKASTVQFVILNRQYRFEVEVNGLYITPSSGTTKET